MALTNRERLIMILAGAAVAILIADRYFLGPVLKKRSQTRQMKQTFQAEVEQAKAVLQRQKVIERRWNQMKDAGLSYKITDVEGGVFRHLEGTSQRSRFLLTSIQPERTSNEGRIGQVEFMVSGTGTLDAVTRFLWDIEMADVPVRIDSLQLGANDEDATQLSLQLKLSTVYLIEEEPEDR